MTTTNKKQGQTVNGTNELNDTIVTKNTIQLHLNTNIPAREFYNNIDFTTIKDKTKIYYDEIVKELELAQLYNYSAKYRYIKVGIILNRAKDELSLSGKDWGNFCERLGLKERTEQRYRKIAKDDRFAILKEEDAYKLTHLTQANMLAMTKDKDKTFYEKLNTIDYDFSKSKSTDKNGKEVDLDKKYKSDNIVSITLDQYKEYHKKSNAELIKVIDDTLTEYNKIKDQNLYKPIGKQIPIPTQTETEEA